MRRHDAAAWVLAEFLFFCGFLAVFHGDVSVALLFGALASVPVLSLYPPFYWHMTQRIERTLAWWERNNPLGK